MCFAEKFLFCVPLDVGCLALGIITFVLGGLMSVCSTVLLVMEHSQPGQGLAYLEGFPELILNSASANILLTSTTIFAVLWMLFSIMLLVGIKKNKSSYVLWYFSFGTIMTILAMLSALLVLLQNHWIVALVKFIMSLIYIHCLTAVHATYELMQTGAEFKLTEELSDETILIESTEEC